MFGKLEYATGREIIAEGRAYLFFGGTAYLGLNAYGPFVDLFKRGIDQYGLNNGNSRANNVQLAIYPVAEEVAAERFGTESALVLSSGFLSAQVVVGHLAPQYDELHYAPHSHPALWVGGEPAVAAEGFKSWGSQLVKHINGSPRSRFLVSSNTVDALRPERYDFGAFGAIRPGKEVHFLLDDSHGLGVLDGLSTFRMLRDRGFRVTVVASLAKAFGVDAGVVLGDGQTIAALRATPAFRGASPPSPAGMYAFVHGERIYKERLERLRENIALFTAGIGRGQFQYIPQFPVFYTADQTMYARLAKAGILISSFPYSSPTGPGHTRIVISAAHTTEDIRRLLGALAELPRGA